MQKITESRYITPAGLVAVLLVLFLIYLPTLQTIVNGSSHIMMIDVGETQVVLNTWGSLHATGYPLYVITGNLLVSIMSWVGISAVTAPALVSMLWGMVALMLTFILVYHLTANVVLAWITVLLYGLTRFMWLHMIIAEVYSFALLWLVLLLVVALWKNDVPHRILWLAFIGGIAVAHYRGIVLAVPALMYAAWPQLRDFVRRPGQIVLGVGLVLIGFIPYIYLPLRAQAGAEWVYGEPDSWSGFWTQFQAEEFGYIFGWPESVDALRANWEQVNTVLVNEISVVGIILGWIGLVVALFHTQYRRPAITFLLLCAVIYGFAVVLYTDILALLIMAITLSLTVGIVFLANFLWEYAQRFSQVPLPARYGLLATFALMLGVLLYQHNYDFLHDLTSDKTGLQTIAQVEQAPPGSTLMLAWGPRYFAVGFAQDVEGKLDNIAQRVDHKGNFARLVQDGPIITPEYTLFEHPLAWWEARIGQPVNVSAAGPSLVAIDTKRQFLTDTELAALPEPVDDVAVVSIHDNIACTRLGYVLSVDWVAREKPQRNLSVLVHLLDANENLIADDDKFAPVFGQRPLTRWQVGEVVHDVYTLERLPNAASIRYGLYEQLAGGGFQNYNVVTRQISCE